MEEVTNTTSSYSSYGYRVKNVYDRSVRVCAFVLCNDLLGGHFLYSAV